MSARFPLYETLRVGAGDRRVSKSRKVRIAQKLPALPLNSRELVYLIIREHAAQKGREESLPYGGRQTSEGVYFPVTQIPKSLWPLLHYYVELDRKAQFDQREEL